MTYSIQRLRDLLRPLACAGPILFAAGCQVYAPQQPDHVDPVPTGADAAIQARQWPVIEASYPNFSSTTGPSEVLIKPADNLNPEVHEALETPFFLADLFILPVAMVMTPPWEQVESSSFYVLPTYTANPPSTPAPGTTNDLSGEPHSDPYNCAPGRAVVAQPPPEQ